MITPNKTAVTIRIVFINPSVPKESLINIVEIINPELRITLLNLSDRKKENKSKSTSINIKIVKNFSKKILFISLILSTISFNEKKLS